MANVPPASIVATISEFPKEPGYLAITGPIDEPAEPVKYAA